MLSRRVPESTEPNPWARLLAARRASGARLVDLTEANPTRVGLTEAGGDALRSLADPRGGTYEPDPRGLASARDAVAAYYAGRGIRVLPEHIVLTSGTSEGYAHIFRLLCDPGGGVAVPRP